MIALTGASLGPMAGEQGEKAVQCPTGLADARCADLVPTPGPL